MNAPAHPVPDADPFADLAADFAQAVRVEIDGAVYHYDIDQGTEDWHKLRLGILTASTMKAFVTPATLKLANNEKTRGYVYELAAQRISQYVEPSFVGEAMERGWEDEIKARALYAEHFAPVRQCGFITSDRWGFTIGYSPDGLIGDDGLWENKSRKQSLHVETVVECGPDAPPSEFLVQIQTGLLVTKRKWLDFTSYSGGLPLCVLRCHPDADVQEAILEAAEIAEGKIRAKVERFYERAAGMIPTERSIIQGVWA